MSLLASLRLSPSSPSIYRRLDEAPEADDATHDDSSDPFANPASPASLPPPVLSPFHDELSRSPPASGTRRSRLAGGGSSMHPYMTATSAGGSSLGNRSLMGLLGGTRMEGFGPGFGVGYGGDVLEEGEEEEHANSELAKSAESREQQIPTRSRSSSTSSHDSSPDPPDFTTRMPLTSPSPKSSRKRTRGPIRLSEAPGRLQVGGMGPKERALWRWVNVEDLDAFLQEVYVYYTGRGVYAIALSRALNLLTVGWVIFFSTFLIGCIDYSRLFKATSLSDAMVPHCVSRFSPPLTLLFIFLLMFYVIRIVRFSIGVRSLWVMHEFFTHLLLIPEDDIQTVPWTTIVSRLADLRETHPAAVARGPSSVKLDAHDVANRIMREENYLIALFNKNVLDLSVPLPEAVETWLGGDRRLGGGLTRTLEWNLSFCLLGFLFRSDGQVRRTFLSERNRAELVEALRNRFILMGVINAIFAPFIFVYLLLWSFFRYFEEYHHNPSTISSRSFTPLARWQFREFNELPHLFQRRISMASPLASAYLAQFPRAKTALVGRFVAFLAGSFAAVLILFSLVDPDAFLHFEVTPGRTVLFYIGLFGTILAVARGLVPDEQRAGAPDELMKEIVEHTHFLPDDWKDNLHSARVNAEFSALFQMKVIVFVQELLSVLITPFVLWYTLPQCAGPIVDFFREFTVHVDGLGYVCSFAVFDFKRHGDARFGAPVEQEPVPKFQSNEGKMEKSFLNFTTANPTWIPRDQTQSLYLSRMTDVSANIHPPSNHQRFRAGLAAGSTGPGPGTAKDKAKLYDRAFQRSLLIGGSRLRSPPSRNEPIREESALDGEGYVATTSRQPFGLNDEVDMEGASTLSEDEGGNRTKGGLTHLLGEVYGGSGKRW